MDRVLVAMSGGVDSSVAAARLRDQGMEVIGVTLHLWDYDDRATGRCCAPEDQYDARRTADALGFPHFTFDRRESFARSVVTPFVDAYLAGETPSPCAACNRGVKLRELFPLADRFGARFVATGHYARISGADSGEPFLARGADAAKDQSYFLYATPREQLRRLVFPLGGSLKSDVRREAIARSLPGAGKGESQELCFVGEPRAYPAFVEARAHGRVRPGPIVDGDGRVVGRHEGVHRFTVGQRRGIGVAADEPLYVTAIDGDAIRVGPLEDLLVRTAALRELFLLPGLTLPLEATVRVRYRHEGARGKVLPGAAPGEAVVTFDEPIRAVTPGQVAVLYEGDRVLGGGVLASVGIRSRGVPEG